jgi:hypothetical protein
MSEFQRTTSGYCVDGEKDFGGPHLFHGYGYLHRCKAGDVLAKKVKAVCLNVWSSIQYHAEALQHAEIRALKDLQIMDSPYAFDNADVVAMLLDGCWVKFERSIWSIAIDSTPHDRSEKVVPVLANPCASDSVL